jgi:hypothetical protein
MANIGELQAVGIAVVDGIYAVKDGLDLADLAVAQQIVTALLSAADDIKEDADSAALEIIAGFASALAAKRRPTVAPEA